MVTDSGGATVEVTATVVISNDIMIPAAALVVAPASTSFSIELGDNGVHTQAVTLRAPGEDAVDWQASSDQPWLTVAKASGSTPEGVVLRVNADGLEAGNHIAALTLAAQSGATALPAQTALVYLDVVAPDVDMPQNLLFLPSDAQGMNGLA